MQASGFKIYFLETAYFFSKILSEFRKKIVALQKKAKKNNECIIELLENCNGLSPQATAHYKIGEPVDEKYAVISADDALELIRASYENFIAKDNGSCNRIGEMESVFLFSLSDCMQRGENKVALITRRNRDLAKMKHQNMVYQNAPDDGNNEGALAKTLRKQMPVLVMIEQTGVNKGWEAPFWWPVYYTPIDMNVGIYADEKGKTGIVENMYSTIPVPMIIEEYPVLDTYGIPTKILKSLQDETLIVQKYFQEHFRIPEILECTNKRKKIKCNVIIEKNEAQTVMADLPEAIEKIIRRAERIFKNFRINNITRTPYITYLNILHDLILSDKHREAALYAIYKCSIGETEKKTLLNLLGGAEELVRMATETWGVFMPLGEGKCEIHLFYDSILNFCKDSRRGEKLVPMMIKYVLAHEMFHSIQYADVMTESGRWIYKKKDYFKQVAVQETLAEYFALCYVRDNIKSNGAKDMFELIHEFRDPEKFPKDGGYSGALILEKNEVKNVYGNENEQYTTIYENSLRDMIKAYTYIK